MKLTSLFPLRRSVLVSLEIALFLGLSGIAVYLWTGPLRAERRLAGASFPDLLNLSKREPDNPRVFYYLGLRLRQLGHDGPAKAAFARAAMLDKDDEDIWLSWAATSAEFTGDQESFGILTMYSKAHPKSVRAHLALALLYQQKNSFLRAFDEEKAVVSLDPKNTGALRMIGSTGLELQKYVDAEDALKKAVALEGNDWRNYRLLGNVLESEHKYTDAIAAYTRATTLAPKEPTPLLGLGRAQLAVATDAKILSDAILNLEHAVTLDPNNARPAIELGKAYLRAKRYTEALTVLLKAEQSAPKEPEIAFNLKVAAEQLGDQNMAQKYNQRHQQLLNDSLERTTLYSQVWQHPKDADLRMRFARLCIMQGDFAAAADSYEHALALDPKGVTGIQASKEISLLQRSHPEVFAVQPLLLPMPAAAPTSEHSTPDLLKDAADMVAHNRYAEAEKTYKAVLARDPNSAAAYEGLGLAYDAQNRVDDAFTNLAHALTLDPSLIKAQFRISGIYYESGFAEEATKRMEKVVARVTDNADYWHALGLGAMTAGSSNRLQLAQTAFAHAVALAPKNPTFIRDLAIAEEKNAHYTESEAHYRQALKLAPDEVTILQSLGNLLAEQTPTLARLSEAETLLRHAEHSTPGNPLVLATLGRVRLNQGDAKEAVSLLEASVERSSGDATVWYNLSRAYQKLGNHERSEYCLKAFRDISGLKTKLANTEEAVRMHLKDPDKRLALARVYASSGQYAKAINQYQMAISLNPTNAAFKTELNEFTEKLKAIGQMPEMSKFNGLLLAATAQEKVNKGFTSASKDSN